MAWTKIYLSPKLYSAITWIKNFNLSKVIYRKLYHVIFLKVCGAYKIIPKWFYCLHNSCNGKPGENVMANWQDELNNIASKLRDLILHEYFQKFFKSKENFNCLLKECLIQEDWSLKVGRHLEKCEKIFCQKKLKKHRKLTKSNKLSYFKYSVRFDSYGPFFSI